MDHTNNEADGHMKHEDANESAWDNAEHPTRSAAEEFLVEAFRSQMQEHSEQRCRKLVSPSVGITSAWLTFEIALRAKERVSQRNE